MNEGELGQQAKDERDLDFLRIGYRVWAAVAVGFALIGLLLSQLWRILPVSALPGGTQGAPPAVLMGILDGPGLGIIIACLGLGALSAITARCLRRRRSIRFCRVAAAISLLGFPLGTLVGALTFVVLARPSVQQLFEPAQSARLA